MANKNASDRSGDWKVALANKQAANQAAKKAKQARKAAKAEETTKAKSDSGRMTFEEYLNSLDGRDVLMLCQDGTTFPIKFVSEYIKKEAGDNQYPARTLFMMKDEAGKINVFAQRSGVWRFYVDKDNKIWVFDNYNHQDEYPVTWGEYPVCLKFSNEDAYRAKYKNPATKSKKTKDIDVAAEAEYLGLNESDLEEPANTKEPEPVIASPEVLAARRKVCTFSTTICRVTLACPDLDSYETIYGPGSEYDALVKRYTEAKGDVPELMATVSRIELIRVSCGISPGKVPTTATIIDSTNFDKIDFTEHEKPEETEASIASETMMQ